jgi:hypothetical protein
MGCLTMVYPSPSEGTWMLSGAGFRSFRVRGKRRQTTTTLPQRRTTRNSVLCWEHPSPLKLSLLAPQKYPSLIPLVLTFGTSNLFIVPPPQILICEPSSILCPTLVLPLLELSLWVQPTDAFFQYYNCLSAQVAHWTVGSFYICWLCVLG